MRPFLLSFFLSLSLFPFSSFFPSPPRDSTARVGCNARFITRVSSNRYRRKIITDPFENLRLRFLPFFLSLRLCDTYTFRREKRAKLLPFQRTCLGCFRFLYAPFVPFRQVSNSYRPYPSVERAWFYLHPCWTARPIFGRDDNFKRLPSRVE